MSCTSLKSLFNREIDNLKCFAQNKLHKIKTIQFRDVEQHKKKEQLRKASSSEKNWSKTQECKLIYLKWKNHLFMSTWIIKNHKSCTIIKDSVIIHFYHQMVNIWAVTRKQMKLASFRSGHLRLWIVNLFFSKSWTLKKKTGNSIYLLFILFMQMCLQKIIFYFPFVSRSDNKRP